MTGQSQFVVCDDGRRLHFVSAGHGTPSVVFESGMGESSSSWKSVPSMIARHARAVAYDRAGYGRSDPDPRERPLSRLADDLRTLLVGLGDLRFILVGHSWGGPVVRTVGALLGAEKVAGIVLVDPTDERSDHYFDPTVVQRMSARAEALRSESPQGTSRFTPHETAAVLAERESFLDDLLRLREAPPVLGDIPVTVISAAGPGADAIRTSLQEAHRMSAQAAPTGRLVLAHHSGHQIMHTEPELIVREVLRLIG
ncbi:MAG: alpha/beta hydrolase [Gordonia amarae]